MFVLFWIPALSLFSKFLLFPFLPQVPFDIYHTLTTICSHHFPRWFWNCTCDLSATSPLLGSTHVLLFVPIFLVNILQSFQHMTGANYLNTHSVLRFCKFLRHALSAWSIFCSYNTKAFVGTVHFIWLYSFYSSRLLLYYRDQHCDLYSERPLSKWNDEYLNITR